MNILLDLIFPKLCYVCGKEGSYLCQNCFKKKIVIDPINRCHVCNKESRIGFVHRECQEYTYLDGILNVTVYDELIKRMVYDIKYNYFFGILDLFADIMSNYLDFYNFSPENTLISYVPSSKSKLKLRGFNQSKILANKLATLSKIPFVHLLSKRKSTKAQAKLHKISRAENLLNAFEFHNNLSNIKEDFKTSFEPSKVPENLNILFLDDIFTTGATLNECAKIIKQAFPQSKVFGYVIAKARS